MDENTQRVRFGLTAKLIVPFVSIFILTLSILGVLFVQWQAAALSRSLEKRAEILVRNLAVALIDPFSVGEYDQLQKLLEAAQNTDEAVAYATLVGMDGFGVASTDASLRNQKLTQNEFDAAALTLSDFTRRKTPRPEVFEVVMPVGLKTQPMGTLRIGVSTHQVNALSRKIGWTATGAGALALIIGVAIYVFVAQRVTRPIRQVVELAQKVAQGDLTIEVKADLLNSRDEIGILARAFSEMSANLKRVMQELIYRIRDNCKEIALSSEALSAASQQMSSDSSETEHLADKVSSTGEGISRTVSTVATSSVEILSSLKAISRDIVNATQITTQAVDMARSTNETISKLGGSSNEIGEVVKVITAIAQQTNLLALNAAIEAARAGEAGKGFAVVANEVKDLAKKTAKATEEITQKIGVIQIDTKEAILAIGKIGEIIDQINKISVDIAGALEEQTVTTNDISGRVAEAARGTNEVSRSILGVATASKSTAKTAVEVLAASKKLAQMGGELIAMVNNFRVEPNRLDTSAVSKE